LLGRNLIQIYYNGVAGIILAYAINKKQTYKRMRSRVKRIEENTKEKNKQNSDSIKS